MGHFKSSTKKPRTRSGGGKEAARTTVHLKKAKGISEVLRLVCDPTRVYILLVLSKGETDVQSLLAAVGPSQLAISHHLALLRVTNLIAARRDGTRNSYSLTEVGQDLAHLLQGLMSPTVASRSAKARAGIAAGAQKDVGETTNNATVRSKPSEMPSWGDLNGRRLKLIDQEVDQGLTAEEETELRALQEMADAYLNVVAPLPFEIFDKLRECAREDGLDLSFLEDLSFHEEE